MSESSRDTPTSKKELLERAEGSVIDVGVEIHKLAVALEFVDGVSVFDFDRGSREHEGVNVLIELLAGKARKLADRCSNEVVETVRAALNA
ncbi:MAG: hypothetical protein AB7D07_07275 [Desulfovibrionaceae bacterium]